MPGGAWFDFSFELLAKKDRFTVYFDIDVWRGLVATLAITLPYYALQRLMPLSEMMIQMMEGFKSMIPARDNIP